MSSKLLFIFAQYLTPHHLISRLVAYLARSNVFAVRYYFIKWFVRRYQVDMHEAAEPDIAQYPSFNDFFTRALRADARPIEPDHSTLICPADGVVSACGTITDGALLQAKGQHYSLTDLLASDSNHGFAQFATIYLSPRDYHRVHMPFEGTLVTMRYVPGKLFSVNNTTAEYVPHLFARNERLVCVFDTKHGRLGCVLVGAMIVAGIATSWAGPIAPTNGRILEWNNQSITIKKGDEVGRFFLGSTVIILLANGTELVSTLHAGNEVKMGQALAHQTQKQ